MRKINIHVLQPGDIVLTTAEAWESALIRFGTSSDISHAMLCVSPASVMDATGEGVQARNPQKMFYPDTCAIHVLRLRTAVDAQVVAAAIEYVRGATGTFYDVWEATKAALPLKRSGNSRQFCSRLVAQAYAYAGVALVKNADYCTPEELKNSPLLVAVPDSVEEASDQEAADWRAEGDTTTLMRRVTNAFIHAVAAGGHPVESFRDVIALAAEKPELDDFIADKLVESSFLDVWKVDQQKFGWRYNITAMVQFQNEAQASEPDVVSIVRAYCKETLAHDALGAFTHWQRSLDAVNDLVEQYPRRTFRLLQELYVTLVLRHGQRVQTARTWLNWRKAFGET